MTRKGGKRLLLSALCLSFALLFAGLGIWQVERLQWKRDLIARVEARLAAAPVPVPPRASWSALDPSQAEYSRVVAHGTLDRSRSTLVDALTERGPGHWVLTPLFTSDGAILINEGFAPKDWRPAAATIPDQRITGLLRPSEPGGRILRPNRPAEGRWYSRDIAAIAAVRGIERPAPFFIDAAAGPDPAAVPVGGLTVIAFPNNHLVYALTWFGLAGLSLFGLALTLRSPHNGG